MTTPLATIADALIEFILSLLRDPAAAAQFAAEPAETLAEAGLSAVRIDAASLVVRAEADTPDEAARAARRVMGLRGRHDERIAAVRAALAREPDRLSLGRELVEALDAAGRPAEALNELLGIAQRFQKRQAAANPAAPEELPDWMLLRFAELEQRTKTAK